MECYKQPAHLQDFTDSGTEAAESQTIYYLALRGAGSVGAGKALTPSARLKFSVLVREAQLMQKITAWCVVWNLWIPPLPNFTSSGSWCYENITSIDLGFKVKFRDLKVLLCRERKKWVVHLKVKLICPGTTLSFKFFPNTLVLA